MRANRMKTVYSSSPSSSSFFDLFNKLFDMLNYLMDDVKALEVFPALEKIFFCSLQRFPLFHSEPCDFSRFSCKENAGCSEKSGARERARAKLSEKSGKKFFISQFVSILSSCRKSGREKREAMNFHQSWKEKQEKIYEEEENVLN